jgi:enolase
MDENDWDGWKKKTVIRENWGWQLVGDDLFEH